MAYQQQQTFRDVDQEKLPYPPAAVQAIKWYSASSGGTLLSSSSSYTTPIITSTESYYVALVSSDGCIGLRTPVQAIVNSIPGEPSAANQSRCGAGTVTLTATGAPSGGTYHWFNSSVVPSDLLGTGPSYTTTSISSSQSYWVATVSGQGCQSTRKEVQAIIQEAPSAPSVSSLGSTSSCEPGSFTVQADLVSGEPVYDYKWYASPTGGSPIGADRFFETPVISTTTSYYVSRTDVCESDRTEITLSINGPSTISPSGMDVPRYGQGSVTLNANDGPYGYKWYDAETGGNFLAQGSSLLTQTLSQTTSFFVTALNEQGCEGSRLELKGIVLDVTSLEIIIEGSQIIPEGSSARISLPGEHDAYQWIRNGLDIPGATDPSYTVTASGNYKVRLTPGGNAAGSFTTPEKSFSAITNRLFGPNVTFVDRIEKYHYTADDFLFTLPQWTVTNGSVVSREVSEDQRRVTVSILWNQSGTGTISLKNGSTQLDTKLITVTANCSLASVPSIPVGQMHHFLASGDMASISLSCGSSEVIQWIDEELVYETIIHEGNNLTIPETTYPKTFKVRSYNPTTHCASHMVPVQLNVFEPIVPQQIRSEVVRISGLTSAEQLAPLTPEEKTTTIGYLDGLARTKQQVL